MTRYVKIQEGKAVKMSSKPTSERTSNLWVNPEAMKAEGWLPVDDKKPSLKEWEKASGRTEEVLQTKVNFNYVVTETPLSEFKKQKVKKLISNAKQLLESRLDPIEQMPSVYKALPVKRREAMDSDAVAVMSEVQTKRKAILSSTGHQEVADVYLTIVAFIDASKLDKEGRIIPEATDLI